MKYYDYTWDLSPDRILLDQELNLDKLGWKHGDLFKVININGQPQLVKLDPLEKFVREGVRK
jgi:aryl-alcohol dehydrogenase-like predicted oxidoreductase